MIRKYLNLQILGFWGLKRPRSRQLLNPLKKGSPAPPPSVIGYTCQRVRINTIPGHLGPLLLVWPRRAPRTAAAADRYPSLVSRTTRSKPPAFLPGDLRWCMPTRLALLRLVFHDVQPVPAVDQVDQCVLHKNVVGCGQLVPGGGSRH